VITRRRIHLLVTLLLPFMALRAFLPAGYMLGAPGAAGWALVMCSQGLYAPPHVSGDGHGGGHQLPQDADHSDHCPFAMATAAVIPVSALWSMPAVSFTLHFTPAATDELPPATGPPRQAPARAPPALPA
jgi:hypothetical protein